MDAEPVCLSALSRIEVVAILVDEAGRGFRDWS